MHVKVGERWVKSKIYVRNSKLYAFDKATSKQLVDSPFLLKALLVGEIHKQGGKNFFEIIVGKREETRDFQKILLGNSDQATITKVHTYLIEEETRLKGLRESR
jgi:hypothetical protein